MPSRRILIVDDHVDSADMTAELLQERGHVTCVAYSSGAAIAAAVNFQPQIALLDIHLPTMNGYALAAHLRASAFLGGCRFIAVTGAADEADRRQSEAAGFHGHLVKPFGAEALFEVIDDDGAASCAPARGWSVG